LIVLRLTPRSLVRAAATCKRWRRVVAADGGTFFHLTCSLHPPVVAGHYHHKNVGLGSSPISFIPLSPPAPIDSECFSLDFLPFDVTSGESHWEVSDCHGGLLVLLSKGYMSRSYIMCEPLTWWYQGIQQPVDMELRNSLCMYLLTGEDSDISISNFRLFGTFCNCAHRVCVFSTADAGGWHFLPSSEEEFNPDCDIASRVDGCLYLGTTWGSLMVLDNASLEFSEVDLPSSYSSEARSSTWSSTAISDRASSRCTMMSSRSLLMPMGAVNGSSSTASAGCWR
jgi:hypothetical protein